MKKLTAISLFIFWALVVALLTSGLVLYQNDRQGSALTASVQPQVATTKTLSMEELARHNSASDCWLLITGKLYDVTPYLNQHPGDASTILPTCGTDATKAYATKGRTTSPKPHSQEASTLLKAYYIGDLGQTPTVKTSGTPIQQPKVTTKPTPPITPVSNSTVTLSTQEIAKHSTTASCWMIVNGNVYDVTSYIPRHPGGAGAISPYCGKDGSAAFEGLPHSTNAHQLLANYLVGAVGQQATIRSTPATNATAPISQGDDDEWDD